MEEEKLTRAERRKLREQGAQSHHHHLKTKKALRVAVVIIILLMIAGYIGYAFNAWRKGLPEKPYTTGPVHWHAKVDVTICGEHRDLPTNEVLAAHGSSAVGTPLLHHHYDNTAHIEGRVFRVEEISLGNFFNVINAPFSETEIFDKKNGDVCPDGKTGNVKFFVNGAENTEWRNYILHDGDRLEIKFD